MSSVSFQPYIQQEYCYLGSYKLYFRKLTQQNFTICYFQYQHHQYLVLKGYKKDIKLIL